MQEKNVAKDKLAYAPFQLVQLREGSCWRIQK